MRRRGGPPPRGFYDRPIYNDFGPPPSPPWERRDPYGFPPSPPPPPGPNRGWHDRPLTPPPPWMRDDFDGPPRPPPPPRRPPPSFADDDFPPPPPPPYPPNGPPRGRGRGGDVRGSNRGRGGRGEGPPRGNQTRGSTRGANNGRGMTGTRGAPNATRGPSRGAPSVARGATRGVPSRGIANGRGAATRGAVNRRGGSTATKGTANWLSNARGGAAKGDAGSSSVQSTGKTENSPQATAVTTNSVPKTANTNNQSYSMLNKPKKEQSKTQSAVVKAAVPGELNFISFKNSLQECCQKQQLPVPAYKTWKNNYGYSAKVEVAGNTFKSTGIQGDHKEAQQSAAYNALISLGLIDSSVSFDVKTATVIKRPAIDNTMIQDPYGKRMKLESASPVATSYKSRLNEFCQKFRLSIPDYETVKVETGKGFITTIVFNKKVYQSNGPQPTKKQSEQNAAQVVLHMLNQCPAPAPSYQDYVEQCKQLTSQNKSTESSSTGTSTTTTSLTTSVAVQQIPLPTTPAVLQASTPTVQMTTTATVQKSSTPTVQHFSTPIVEKISTTEAPPKVPATTAKLPTPFTSHKNSLQEYCQKNKLSMPVYYSQRENGVFTCTVHVAGVSYTSNSCNTKKGSEQTAANVALKALGLV